MTPLILDLDGTLVRGDTLIECALRLLARRPLALLRALPLARTDRAAFKARLAQAAGLDPASLVYDPAVLGLARAARAQGGTVFLATAADRVVADGVAGHLGLFDGVMASGGGVNLKGAAKARALVARFGAGGFDYAGDSVADLPVWAQARRAIVVGASPGLLARAEGVCASTRAMGAAGPAGAAWRLALRAMRPHQWAKNLLVFVPVAAAHQAHGVLLAQACLGFVAFSCARPACICSTT